MKDVYLDFGGWLKLDPNTRMQYIGNNEGFDPVITVAVWQSLPEENRGEYRGVATGTLAVKIGV